MPFVELNVACSGRLDNTHRRTQPFLKRQDTGGEPWGNLALQFRLEGLVLRLDGVKVALDARQVDVHLLALLRLNLKW